jgi:hypothetical protein
MRCPFIQNCPKSNAILPSLASLSFAQTKTHQAAFTVFAKAARDIERHAYPIPHFDTVDRTAGFDDHAQVFMSEYFS